VGRVASVLADLLSLGRLALELRNAYRAEVAARAAAAPTGGQDPLTSARGAAAGGGPSGAAPVPANPPTGTGA